MIAGGVDSSCSARMVAAAATELWWWEDVLNFDFDAVIVVLALLDVIVGCLEDGRELEIYD